MDLFDTQEKIDAAVANFTMLLDHPGWKLVESILQENIEVLKQQLLDGSEGETKESIDRLRDKLKAYEEAKETPRMMILKLSLNETEEIVDDPYDTEEDVKKRREATGG